MTGKSVGDMNGLTLSRINCGKPNWSLIVLNMNAEMTIINGGIITLNPSRIASKALFMSMNFSPIITGTVMINVAMIPLSKSISFNQVSAIRISKGRINPHIFACEF